MSIEYVKHDGPNAIYGLWLATHGQTGRSPPMPNPLILAMLVSGRARMRRRLAGVELKDN